MICSRHSRQRNFTLILLILSCWATSTRDTTCYLSFEERISCGQHPQPREWSRRTWSEISLLCHASKFKLVAFAQTTNLPGLQHWGLRLLLGSLRARIVTQVRTEKEWKPSQRSLQAQTELEERLMMHSATLYWWTVTVNVLARNHQG
eukprot:1220681-Rhodomonas_salina.1